MPARHRVWQNALVTEFEDSVMIPIFFDSPATGAFRVFWRVGWFFERVDPTVRRRYSSSFSLIASGSIVGAAE
jgi:hypothetical protein